MGTDVTFPIQLTLDYRNAEELRRVTGGRTPRPDPGGDECDTAVDFCG